MVCILLNKNDVAGHWLAGVLKQRGRQQVMVIYADDLVQAKKISCGFKNGQPFYSLQLQSGFVFSSDKKQKLLNRISHLSIPYVNAFQTKDRSYVQAEMQAIICFILSASLNHVFNAANGNGLSGAIHSNIEWKMMAKEHKLPIQEFLFQQKKLIDDEPVSNSSFSVVAFNGKCYTSFKNFSLPYQTKLIGLQKAAGVNILEAEFLWREDRCIFRMATAKPQFRHITPEFIHDLIDVL